MDLHYEFYIGGTPEQVWDALVSPEGTRNVFFGSELRCSLEAGSEMAYVGPGEDGTEVAHIRGKILECHPGERLSHTYFVGESYIPGHADYASRVTYDLEAIGKCTKLTVTHDQWSEGDPAKDNTAKGWWRILSILKTYVETGQPLDLGAH